MVPLKDYARPEEVAENHRLADRGRAPGDRRDHLHRRRHAHQRGAGVRRSTTIIVGAGSAGCVLASRLSADGPATVLLLEAGPRDTDPWIHIPLGYGKLFTRRDVNWAYESEPEPNLGGRRVFSPRGKVLGGSSSINGLVYIRGQPEDYDGWEVPGWSHAELLPYFRKSQNQQRGASALHGAGGPIGVSDMERHELADAFIESAAAIGMPRNDDFNGDTQEGTGYYQCTTGTAGARAPRSATCAQRRSART